MPRRSAAPCGKRRQWRIGPLSRTITPTSSCACGSRWPMPAGNGSWSLTGCVAFQRNRPAWYCGPSSTFFAAVRLYQKTCVPAQRFFPRGAAFGAECLPSSFETHEKTATIRARIGKRKPFTHSGWEAPGCFRAAVRRTECGACGQHYL